MNIWICVFASFIALVIIAISMAGLFFLLTKATEKRVSSFNPENDISTDEDETIHF